MKCNFCYTKRHILIINLIINIDRLFYGICGDA